MPESSSLSPLHGKRVILTGGSSGIGRATAALLAADGCRVFTCSRNAEKLSATLESLQGAGGDVAGCVADLGTPEGIQHFFKEADRFLGQVDIAVMNAAVPSKGELSAMTDEEWRYVLAANLLGPIGCCREAILRMTGKGGHLLITGSMSADVFDTRATAYVTAKAGLRAFAMTLRKEVNPLRIKVSIIEPGSVASDMVDENDEEKEQRISEHQMLRPEDVAEAIRFMLMQPERSDIIKLQLKPQFQFI